MSFFHTTPSLLTSASSCQRALVALLVIASLGALSGCVDSENEILLRAPIGMSCGDLVYPPNFEAKGDLNSSVQFASLTINLSELSTKGQPLGIDTSASPPVVYATDVGPGTGMTVNAVMQNTLTATTSYTSIGALREHRLNQNDFAARSVKLEWIVDKSVKEAGIDLPKLTPKEISASVSVGGSTTVGLIPILSPQEVIDLQQVIPAGSQVEVKMSFQITGELFSGYGIDTSKAVIPVILLNDPNSKLTSTPICSPKK